MAGGGGEAEIRLVSIFSELSPPPFSTTDLFILLLAASDAAGIVPIGLLVNHPRERERGGGRGILSGELRGQTGQSSSRVYSATSRTGERVAFNDPRTTIDDDFAGDSSSWRSFVLSSSPFFLF